MPTSTQDIPTPLLPGLEDGAVVMIDPTDRKVYSTKGVALRRPRVGVRLRYHTEGELTLHDGRIGAGDLLSDGYSSVFAHRVQPGTYPIITICAETETESVVAFAAIRFSRSTAAKCKLALYQGENPAELTDDMCGGLGTDSGTVSLGSPDEAVDAIKHSDEDLASFRQIVERALARNNRFAQVRGLHGAPICVWHSGFGDGMYSPYWGIGQEGEICFLAVDFAVVANGLRSRTIKWRTVGKSLQMQPKRWWHRLLYR